MKKITFVISHRPDNRYLKRINVLKKNYKLNLIFWNKTDVLIHPVINEVEIDEIQIVADQTNPLKRLPQTQQFIKKAYQSLCKIKPDIVYVGNLDMLHIARKYKHKVNSHAKIIYEIADLHTKLSSIGSSCWVCARTIILPGSKVNDRAIIGANSVFKGEAKTAGIYGGNPCQYIRKRKVDENYEREWVTHLR